ncbi:MAG: hypothetical protein DRP01_11235 [Archaeoglobales archaeon]|nr:MAG: hypothetical protein DRP01_11235 [Archaeoglobales archaeon]
MGILKMRKGKKKVSTFWLEISRGLSFILAALTTIYAVAPYFIESITYAIAPPLLLFSVLTIIAYIFLLIDYAAY